VVDTNPAGPERRLTQTGSGSSTADATDTPDPSPAPDPHDAVSGSLDLGHRGRAWYLTGDGTHPRADGSRAPARGLDDPRGLDLLPAGVVALSWSRGCFIVITVMLLAVVAGILLGWAVAEWIEPR
jgi:hypothetical protein